MKSDLNTSSVEKAFALLEFLAELGKPTSLQAITEAVKLSKPTAYRLLQSLQELGYVTRPADSRSYLIGPRTARLAAADPHSELKSVAKPLLQRLFEAFNETVNLGVLSGKQVLYLDFLETTQALRYAVTPGQSDPYYCTALGRAIASQMNEKQLDRLFKETRFQQLTPQTTQSQLELQKKIRKAHQTGVAEELEESVSGVCCLAVSLAALGFPEAAISIAIPAQRLSARRKTELVEGLRNLSKV